MKPEDQATVEEILEPSSDFEGELFLSTDGKQTVHFKSSSSEGRKAGLDWAFRVYERIVERLGTKAQMWDGVMNKQAPLSPKPAVQSSVAPVCGIHNVSMVYKEGGVSKVSGRPYPGFWSCPQKENGTYCKYRAPGPK